MAGDNPIFYFKVAFQVTRDGNVQSYVTRYNKSADPLNDRLQSVQELILSELKEVYPESEFQFTLIENTRMTEDEYKLFVGKK